MRLSKKKKNGFTLLELMLVIAGISILSVGGFVLYQHTNMQAQTSLAVSNSRLLSNIVMQSYGQSGSFASLNDTSLINGRLLPNSFHIQNNTIQTRWGGTIQVNPFDVNNDTFAITWNKVPAGPCSNMVSQLSKNFPEIQVNSTDVKNSNQSQKLNVSTVSSLCGGSDNNQVVLVSNAVAQPTTGQPADPTGTGNVPVIPPVIPPKTNPVIIPPSVISAVLPQTYKAPAPGPAVSQVNPVVTPGTVSNARYNSTPPPITALPPQTCFPSVTNTPVNTTEYNTQTLACSAGYTGAITQQQSQVKTVTTTNTITCATPWSAPVSKITSATTYSAWTAWVTTGDTCAQMCSTILASSLYQPNPQNQTQWVNVNPGCPAGYTGTHTYQAQQKSTRSASCANPSAPVNPVWTAWSAWTNTGATQNVVDTCALTCASQLSSATWKPNPQTQYQWVTVNQGCPAGYVGSKYYQAQQYSTRTASCANPSGTAAPTWGAWSGWVNTGATQGAVNTCAATCNTQLASATYKPNPQTQYRWVTVNQGCPAGYVGSKYYQAQQSSTRSASCANPGSTVAPTWSGWSGWANTGATQGAVNTCAATCATQLSWGGYPTHYNYRWVTVNVGCPAGYTGSNYYQAQQVQASSAYCSNPSGTAAPIYGGWSGWWNTGATQGAVNTCAPSGPKYNSSSTSVWRGSTTNTVNCAAGQTSCAANNGTFAPGFSTGGMSSTFNVSCGGVTGSISTTCTSPYGGGQCSKTVTQSIGSCSCSLTIQGTASAYVVAGTGTVSCH